MDVVIENAYEACKACMPHLRWVTDAVAASMTDFDAPIDAPPENLMARVIHDTIYKTYEVPFGWFVTYNTQQWIKNMRETGAPGDAPYLIGGGLLLVNRWTGAVTEENGFEAPTLAGFARWYISHKLPDEQREACLSAPWKERWDDNDPVRFDPPSLEIDKALGIHQEMDLNLEIDASHLVYFGGKPPRLSPDAVLSEHRTIVYKWELVSTCETDTTHLYSFKLYLNISRHGRFVAGSDRCFADIIRPASETEWDEATNELFSQYPVIIHVAT